MSNNVRMNERTEQVGLGTNDELLSMSTRAAADALQFEVGLKDGTRWKDDAEAKISERLDKIRAELPGLDLRSAFAYKATMKVVVQFIVSSDVAVAARFYQKMKEHHEIGRPQAIAKRLAQGNLSEREQLKLREFQGLLGDSVTMFYNAADLVMGKHGLSRFA